MSEQDRPDLSARRRPRPVENLADPADPAAPPTTPITGTNGTSGPDSTAGTDSAPEQAQSAPPAAPNPGTERQRPPMVAIDTGSTATYAIQYRLTEAERNQLLRMQEARGDRRGIDTMRWFLATYGEQAIIQARRETEARQHHYR